MLIFCVQHTGIERVFPADHIDKEYGRTLRKAIEAGVEVIAYKAAISLSNMRIEKEGLNADVLTRNMGDSGAIDSAYSPLIDQSTEEGHVNNDEEVV